MTREYREPTITEGRVGACDPHDVFEHDAYATIQMTVSTGGCETLFGSDLPHNQRVHITIQRAELHRHLNRDWIHGSSQPIVDFSMSFAQFSQFIMSQGNGRGTPITLNRAPARGMSSEPMPYIKNHETKHETFRREIVEAATKRLQAMRNQITKLGTMIDSGKIGKKELREIHKDLAREADYLPGSLKFVVESAEEALEQATSDSMIEVESFIAMSAQRVGLNSISELGQLVFKDGTGEK